MGSKSKQPGRPTIITKAIVQKLEQALRDGFSIAMACHVSGVARSTYYAHLQTDPDFMDKMTLAEDWATQRAKQVVIQEINAGSLKASQWWLEKRCRAEFGANPSSHFEQQSTPIEDRYFGGDTEKFWKFMTKTHEALQEKQAETK
jgi:hypothetical protein